MNELVEKALNSLMKEEAKDYLNNPTSVANMAKLIIGAEEQENILVFALNTRNGIIDYEVIHKGTVDQSIVHPRDIFKFAIKSNASKIILAHNHPGGSTQPSSEDVKTTERIKKGGEILGIELIDHIIVTPQQKSYSFKGNNLL